MDEVLRCPVVSSRRENMSHLDDLPRRDRNSVIEDKAVAAFQKLISKSEDFIYQGADRKDFGTDCQIEVMHGNQATNVRVHVQVQGYRRRSKGRRIDQHSNQSRQSQLPPGATPQCLCLLSCSLGNTAL